MIIKDKLCKCGCGKRGKIWSKGMLKQCFFRLNPPKSLKKSYISKQPSEKQKLKNIEKAERTKKLHQWFQELWENEPHYSELSSKWLGYENNTCFWHHIYPKSNYPEYEFDRDNIIRLTADEHQEVEANPTKFHIINEKRAKLKEKYGI